MGWAVWNCLPFYWPPAEAAVQGPLGINRSEAGEALGLKVPWCFSPVPGLSHPRAFPELRVPDTWRWNRNTHFSHGPSLCLQSVPVTALLSSSQVRQPTQTCLVKNDFTLPSCQNTVFLSQRLAIQTACQLTCFAPGPKVREECAGVRGGVGMRRIWEGSWRWDGAGVVRAVSKLAASSFCFSACFQILPIIWLHIQHILQYLWWLFLNTFFFFFGHFSFNPIQWTFTQLHPQSRNYAKTCSLKGNKAWTPFSWSSQSNEEEHRTKHHINKELSPGGWGGCRKTSLEDQGKT